LNWLVRSLERCRLFHPATTFTIRDVPAYNLTQMSQRVIDIEKETREFERPTDRDLGFGSVVTAQTGPRFINRDGSFNVQRDGFSLLESLNPYHTLLTMSWPKFLGLMLMLYFVSNVVFGSLYASFGVEGLVDSTGSMGNIFLRGFFFSVQTFATIGYGTLHPIGLVPNLLVTIESYYSLIANALITGVVFARFARPTAKVIFSDIAVIAPYQDITGFMFRLVNGRNNQLIEIKAQVIFARFVSENGKTIRKFDLLALERRSVTFFPLTWTVVHPIDEGSPLWGCTDAEQDAVVECCNDPEKAAVAFGKAFSCCAVCHCTLTNDGSIERGIGPICAEKFGW